jgi:hypothetical protein
VKIFLFVLFMCLVSAFLIARDLSQLSRAEKARRQAVAATRKHDISRTFTNRDLKRYHRGPAPRLVQRSSRPGKPQRDLAKERAYWQKEKEKHRRELARLDARIRRLEWRLAERRARRKPGERLHEDPAEEALEGTLKSMEDERRKLIAEFLERGRKGGALPGWLR